MTKEEKDLLLKDLYARILYGFTVHRYSDNRDITFEPNELDEFAHFLEYSEGEEFKPYLRPMDSMTEDEVTEFISVNVRESIKYQLPNHEPLTFWECSRVTDWLNAHHFDYRIDPSTGKTLIESGLAIEAPERMYKIK